MNNTFQISTLPTWLTIDDDTPLPGYKAVKVEYIFPEDERNNQGVNIYIKTLDKDGKYRAGVTVFQGWPDGAANALTRPEGELDFNGESFGAAFEMTADSSFSPGPPPGRGESGPYSGYVVGNSDVVQGMGLPLRRHVQFLLTFQWTEEGPTPPPPSRRVWMVTEQSKHKLVIEKVLVS